MNKRKNDLIKGRGGVAPKKIQISQIIFLFYPSPFDLFLNLTI